MENVYIAKLGKTVGLKGEIKIFLQSDFPEQFRVNASFATNKKTTLVVESFNEKRGVIKFKGIDSIDAAKRLTNTEIFTSIEQTKESCNLQKKQYFWFDIKDCKILENVRPKVPPAGLEPATRRSPGPGPDRSRRHPKSNDFAKTRAT